MAARYCNLTDRTVIAVRGADAGAFLHGQLSQALASLGPDAAPLAAWHDARGRVRALVRVHRLPDHWLLVAPRDGADALVAKLRMFVLRSAVTLAVAPETAVGAVIDAAPDWLLAHGLPQDAAPNRAVSHGEVRFTRIGERYWEALGPRAALAALAGPLPPASLDEAAAAEIALGLPLITAAASERFVAQMLNLDKLGALAFDKGCYPGQEIIARVHNLGGVKRRLRRYAAPSSPPPVGTSVVTSGTAVGEVVRSAATPGGCELLALVDNAATDASLTSDGTPLSELPLPFAVPRD